MTSDILTAQRCDGDIHCFVWWSATTLMQVGQNVCLTMRCACNKEIYLGIPPSIALSLARGLEKQSTDLLNL